MWDIFAYCLSFFFPNTFRFKLEFNYLKYKPKRCVCTVLCSVDIGHLVYYSYCNTKTCHLMAP